MTLEQRVSELEDKVGRLTADLEAGIERLRVTSAELSRQTRRFSPGSGWPPTKGGMN